MYSNVFSLIRICVSLIFFAQVLFVSCSSFSYGPSTEGIIQTLQLPDWMFRDNRSVSVRGLDMVYDHQNTDEGGKMEMMMYFVSSSVANSGVYSLNFSSGNVTRLVGKEDENMCTTEASETSKTMPVTPLSIQAVNTHNILWSDAMPSARVFLISTLSPYTSLVPSAIHTPDLVRMTKVLGSSCNFTQHIAKNNSAAIQDDADIGPADYVLYHGETDQLFFTQSSFVGAVQGNMIRMYFGSYVMGSKKQIAEYRQSPVYRTEAKSNYPAQMVINDEKGEMYIAESGLGIVRVVNTNTGMASVAVGKGPMSTFAWPPTECTKASPCTAATVPLLAPTALALFRPTNDKTNPWLLIGDRTAAVIYVYRLNQNEVYIIAGSFLHSGWDDGHALNGVGRLSAIHQFSTSLDTLYVADGKIRALRLTSGGSGNAENITYPEVCTLIKDCNGRGIDVTGLSAVHCNCTCRYGWKGTYCEEREDWNPETKTITLPLPIPEPVAIPVAVQESAEVTVVVTAVTLGVISTPTMATQASRATLLFRMAKCSQEFGEPLDWIQNFMLVSIGDTVFKYHLGTIVGNVGMFLLAMLLHLALSYIYKVQNQLDTLEEAMGILRFPSLAAFPMLLWYEGTINSIFTVLIHASELWMRLVSAGALLICLVVVGVVGYYLFFRFSCKFHTFGKEDDENLPFHKKVIRYMMHGRGKWTDPVIFPEDPQAESGYFRKRFSSFFVDYGPKRHQYVLIELLFAFSSGLLDAVKPGKSWCLLLIILLSVMFWCYLISLVVMVPYITKFNMYSAVVITFLQSCAAVFLLVFLATHDIKYETASNAFTVASIYLLGLKSLVDVIEVTFNIIHFVGKKYEERKNKKSEKRVQRRHRDTIVASASVALEMPMIEPEEPSPILQTPLSSPNASFAQPTVRMGERRHQAEEDYTEVYMGEGQEEDPMQDADLLNLLLGDNTTNAADDGSGLYASAGPRALMHHEVMRQELQATLDHGLHTHANSITPVEQHPQDTVDELAAFLATYNTSSSDDPEKQQRKKRTVVPTNIMEGNTDDEV